MRRANMKNKVVSAALISANVLTLVTPAVVHAADQPATSSQSSLVQNNKQEDKNKKGETATDKKEDKTKGSSTAVDLKSEKKKDSNENPQTLKEQTMVLQKVIATSEDDLNSDSLKGVNGAKFTVYDVTDLMNTIIKEKLKVSDFAPTDEAIDKAVDKFNEDGKEVVNTTADVKEEVASRAAKLDPKEMKTFAQVTTEHDKESNKDGVARVKLPIDGKYHAYYIVNTETPKEALAKNSDPIVLLTPVTDKDGKYTPEFKVYPKSDKITPETPNKPDNPQTPNKENEQKKDNPTPTQAQEGDKPTVTDAKMVQTGKEHGFLKTVMSYLENFFN